MGTGLNLSPLFRVQGEKGIRDLVHGSKRVRNDAHFDFHFPGSHQHFLLRSSWPFFMVSTYCRMAFVMLRVQFSFLYLTRRENKREGGKQMRFRLRTNSRDFLFFSRARSRKELWFMEWIRLRIGVNRYSDFFSFDEMFSPREFKKKILLRTVNGKKRLILS